MRRSEGDHGESTQRIAAGIDARRPGPRGNEGYLYYPARNGEGNAPEHTQLLEYLRVIKRHARSITALAILGAMAGGGLAMLTKPKYRRTRSTSSSSTKRF